MPPTVRHLFCCVLLILLPFQALAAAFIAAQAPLASCAQMMEDGMGVLRGDGRQRAMVTPGIALDYDTTRVYLAGTARLHRAAGVNHDDGAARAGFSFYDAGYEQTQPWLIIEARRMHGLSERTEITPMLRLINKNHFVEAGINTMRDARFNDMFIF
jgi:hypothetical protein